MRKGSLSNISNVATARWKSPSYHRLPYTEHQTIFLCTNIVLVFSKNCSRKKVCPSKAHHLFSNISHHQPAIKTLFERDFQWQFYLSVIFKHSFKNWFIFSHSHPYVPSLASTFKLSYTNNYCVVFFSVPCQTHIAACNVSECKIKKKEERER